MDWVDALKISAIILASLGGGGGIVLALLRFIGRKWLQDWKGEIDARLQRLDAALAHRNYVLQRFAEFELEAITECWRAARACLPLINSTRPCDSGTDEAGLEANWASLSEGHNRLIAAIGRHEMFLSAELIGTLDSLARVLRLELSNIRHHERFAGSWWDDGERNRAQFQELCSTLLNQVKTRATELRADVSPES